MNTVAVMFPGQGAQRLGMARDFFESFPESKQAFDTASHGLGLDLAELCFNDETRLNLTEFTQPAILTAEIAIYRALQEQKGLQPSFFAGHSLGEYAALVAADVIKLEDAVKIVRHRGALMQGAVPPGVGAMAACIHEAIQETDFFGIIARAGVEAANINSPDQIVISGAKAEVQEAGRLLAIEIPKMRIVALNVSAPFHSKLMAPIEPAFREFLATFLPRFNLTNAPKVLSNFTGEFHTAESLSDALVRQISGPVRWLDNMKALANSKAQVIEPGPMRVLSRFFSAVGGESSAVTDLRTFERLTLQ